MASMNCNALAVITLNFICICFGKSLPIDNSSIANSLNILAKTCANPLIASQISDKIVACNITTYTSHNKLGKFDCLLFYDINKQLCQAAKDSNLVVNEDEIMKLNTSRNIEDLCKSAMAWNITNLEEYPHYKITLDQLIKLASPCGVICKGDDIESLDANFYCKYYSWGIDLLKNTATGPKTIIENTAAEGIVPEPSDISSKTAITSGSDLSIHTASQNIAPNQVRPDVKLHTVDKNVTVGGNLAKTGGKTPALEQAGADVNNDDIKIHSETAPLPPVIPVVNSETGNEVAEKPQIVPIKPIDDKNNISGNDNNNGNDKDGNGFGDGNRPIYNDDATEYYNIEGFEQANAAQTIPKKTLNVDSRLSFNGEVLPQKEQITHTFPEGYEEDSDSFIPVFLTGVIMVVLLYVLYHNKSRVSKMVLGLIVEGRQSNRRRNSRGHAYRRLDTLEQAMNTNQSAAPSKIIY